MNKLIIITAPSGAGKSSIAHYLLSKHPNLAFSISAATRAPRGKEQNGVDYYFMSAEEFQEKIEQNKFIEWEMVYEGKYYGTLKSELERIWHEGKTPMLDIDVKGAIHVQKQFGSNCLSIFIEPPSIDALRQRLESRNTDTKESIETRINKASYELSFKNHFDKIIVNDELKRACMETEETIQSFLKK
ncbi:guanylate kinase [Arachidicoccus ginsenosidimutans]|uniref:guanylate kinase n=1 Tax=Arachidicoccus sp. BS20 TaxID=1850526 RepID=UPI0007F0D2D4|nr:guanylate kinase [Arachidicoccus sp. BS20]ANI88560.1 guanylate kinase [Arachidicoccus sp. BS20]